MPLKLQSCASEMEDISVFSNALVLPSEVKTEINYLLFVLCKTVFISNQLKGKITVLIDKLFSQ